VVIFIDSLIATNIHERLSSCVMKEVWLALRGFWKLGLCFEIEKARFYVDPRSWINSQSQAGYSVRLFIYAYVRAVCTSLWNICPTTVRPTITILNLLGVGSTAVNGDLDTSFLWQRVSQFCFNATTPSWSAKRIDPDEAPDCITPNTASDFCF